MHLEGGLLGNFLQDVLNLGHTDTSTDDLDLADVIHRNASLLEGHLDRSFNSVEKGLGSLLELCSLKLELKGHVVEQLGNLDVTESVC
jgi:hypothetical protein